jgi:hypothetical protein
MVQLDALLLDSFLATAFAFSLGSFYFFLNYFLYPFFLQSIPSTEAARLTLAPTYAELSEVGSCKSYSFGLYPNSLFSGFHPFSEKFAINYPNVTGIFLLENFLHHVYSERMDYFFFCVDQFFLFFESALEEFDIYCRVNQSLLRFRYRFFY